MTSFSFTIYIVIVSFFVKNLSCGGALRAISFFSKKSPCGRRRAASPLGLRPRRLQSIFRRPRSPPFRAAYAVLMTASKAVFDFMFSHVRLVHLVPA